MVGDRKYTGLPSQVADAQWCGEHCLHRCSLTFFTASFGNSSTAPAKQVRTFEEMPAKAEAGHIPPSCGEGLSGVTWVDVEEKGPKLCRLHSKQ